MEIIKSVGNSQEEILNNAIQLHSPSKAICADLTYSKGVFYKNGVVAQPKHKFDLYPQTEDTIEASSDSIPLESGSLKCIVFDPPFVISGKTYKDSEKDSCKISKRFGCYYHYSELKGHYYNTLKECYRLLEENGIVIMKFQNTISSGKQYFTHYFTMKSAIELGFYPKDEFVLHNKSKMTSFGGRWKTQEHAMKHHSYFLVFKKCKNKIDYEVGA